MNTGLKLAAVLPLAATLAACASLSAQSLPEDEALNQVASGLTQEQVRDIAGKPERVLESGENSAVWTYPFRDEWGYSSHMDITFDHGVATGKYSERDR